MMVRLDYALTWPDFDVATCGRCGFISTLAKCELQHLEQSQEIGGYRPISGDKERGR